MMISNVVILHTVPVIIVIVFSGPHFPLPVRAAITRVSVAELIRICVVVGFQEALMSFTVAHTSPFLTDLVVFFLKSSERMLRKTDGLICLFAVFLRIS